MSKMLYRCSSNDKLTWLGPNAGDFFPDHFVQLWDNGVFVQKLGMATINAAANTSSNSTATAQQSVTQDVEITSPLSEVDVDDAVGTVHADDEWSEDDAQTPAPTTPTPTTAAPIVVQVESPHTMVEVDVIPDDEYSDETRDSTLPV